jgi:hypothetical protein
VPANLESYPPAFRESPSIGNPFDHQGARAYKHITFVAPDDDHEAVVRDVLARDDLSAA